MTLVVSSIIKYNGITEILQVILSVNLQSDKKELLMGYSWSCITVNRVTVHVIHCHAQTRSFRATSRLDLIIESERFIRYFERVTREWRAGTWLLLYVMTGVFFTRQKEGNDARWLPLIVGVREKRENHEEEGRSVKFGGGGPQARLSVIGAGYAGTGSAKMPRSLPTRRGLQALALVLATAYATILLYQAVAPRQVNVLICLTYVSDYC